MCVAKAGWESLALKVLLTTSTKGDFSLSPVTKESLFSLSGAASLDRHFISMSHPSILGMSPLVSLHYLWIFVVVVVV